MILIVRHGPHTGGVCVVLTIMTLNNTNTGKAFFHPTTATSTPRVRATISVLVRQPRAKSSQDARTVDDLMIQAVYYYLPAEIKTAEVASCVITYTLSCQDSHNPQYANTPRRYVTAKLKRRNQ